MELKTYGQRLQAIYSLQACIKIQAFRLIKLILKIIIIISIIITYESSVKKKMLIDLKLCVAQKKQFVQGLIFHTYYWNVRWVQYLLWYR